MAMVPGGRGDRDGRGGGAHRAGEGQLMNQHVRPPRNEQQRNELAREVRHHFNSKRNFEFESIVGQGSYGLACRIIQRHYRGGSRKFVIKRATGDLATAELRREIEAMELLNGSAHIASVIASIDDQAPQQPRLNRAFRQMTARLQNQPNAFLIGLRGPSLVIENLEYGTLTNVIRRSIAKKQLLPNRILWSFYLCLVRACVAMAYPPNRPLGSPSQLERYPRALVVPSDLAHLDIHTSNVLIGAPDNFSEHDLVPPIKLIDFGRAREKNMAVQWNLLECSAVMVNLIARTTADVLAQRGVYRGFETMAAAILPGSDGRDRYRYLDPDLRGLLVYALAVDSNNRPSLKDMLRNTEDAVKRRDAAYYNEVYESDAAIEHALDDLIYNVA
ncbi:hypothetical protein F4861DRAFT_90215 [Xylaria intraflava]|nr:hypothetical protein F4861DRAFT_90215 [Xylaria intraflava]